MVMDHDRFFYVQMDWYRIILVFGVFFALY